MEWKNTLLAVKNLEESIRFYHDVLGLEIVADFGANVTLTGGLALQTAESWAEFIELSPEQLGWCGKVGELYFEEKQFDAFIEKLQTMDIHYVHPVKEHSWGQRVVRLYDPDCHIIEIGELLETVCLRFRQQGMSVEQIAQRMDIPFNAVMAMLLHCDN